MSAIRKTEPIRIGVIADEPIRLAGLASIFDQPGIDGHAQLQPVPGTMRELLAKPALKYLVVDLQSSASGFKAIETIRNARPDVRMIVIGPSGNEELVMKSIVAGARAYVDLGASPEIVHSAVEIVTQGSIWAPRRLLSKLIDRLLDNPDPVVSNAPVPRLTLRERQVMELILRARSNKEIAEQLGIEERTVRAHLARLMRKAGADNRIKLSMSPLGRSVQREQSGRPTAVSKAKRPIN
jgi:Response regulator containing a CheY-like receiver domain and an HTH DNA-binding domain